MLLIVLSLVGFLGRDTFGYQANCGANGIENFLAGIKKKVFLNRKVKSASRIQAGRIEKMRGLLFISVSAFFQALIAWNKPCTSSLPWA